VIATRLPAGFAQALLVMCRRLCLRHFTSRGDLGGHQFGAGRSCWRRLSPRCGAAALVRPSGGLRGPEGR
jgi:hypothetical protein